MRAVCLVFLGACVSVPNPPPNHEDRTLYNEGVAQELNGQYAEAKRTYERVTERYPASAVAPSALFRAAVNAEKSYAFDDALRLYRALIDRFPDDDDRLAALFNVARLLGGLRRDEESAEAWLRVAREYPAADDAAMACFRAGLLFERLGNCARAVTIARECQGLVEAPSEPWQTETRRLVVACGRPRELLPDAGQQLAPPVTDRPPAR